MDQVQKQRSTHARTQDDTSVEPVPQPDAHRLSEETADLLDDIDDLLDEMGEDVVKHYRQLNGE